MRSRSRWGVPTIDGWGELLYEPEWSRRRPLKDWDVLLWFVPIPVLAVAMVYEFDWMFVAVILFIAGFGGFLAWLEFASMPFRVYRGGFTETYVPLRRGVRRRETVVPASRLDKVTITKEETRGIDVYTVLLQYRSPEGEESKLALDHSDVDDPMAVLLALRAAAPAAMDETTDTFIGPGAIDAVYTVPEDHWRRRKRGSLNAGGFIFLCIAASIAVFAAPEDVMTSGRWEAILVVTAVTAVTALFLGFATYALARDFEEHFQLRAKVEGDVLRVARMPGHKLLARCRGRVPLGEVERARKSLDKVSFFHKTRLDMVSGETLELPYEVFEALEADPAFRREGFDLVNAGEVATRGRPVARPSPAKVLLILLVLLYVLNRI